MQKGEDFTGLTVVYFCHDGKRNVVMGKRNGNARDEQNCWDIGGGAVEFGDTIEDTLRKEIAEEYCTDVLAHELLGYRDVLREYNGKKTHWLAMDFKVLIDPTKVACGEPHKFDAVGLFPFEKLPTPTHSQLPTFLELHKDKLF